MPYSYDHPRPSVTVDCVLFAVQDRELRVLLIRRGSAPFKGRWAFPGGYVDQDEDLEDAALRELEEETGLTGVALDQLAAFGEPGRDPRGHTVTIAWMGLVAADLRVKGSDDAADARWHPAEAPPPLAFDHAKMLALALDRLRTLATSSPIGLDALPRTFAFERLHELYEVVLGVPIDARSLKRSLVETGVLRENARGLVSFDRKRYAELAREGVLLEIVE